MREGALIPNAMAGEHANTRFIRAGVHISLLSNSASVKAKLLLSSIALGCLLVPAYALDWEAAKRDAAQVTVVNCEPVPLVEGTGKGQFLKVGKKLTDAGAQVFVQAPGKKTSNVADLSVTKDGWVLIAAHYGYEGNSQGDWDKEAWDEKKFKKGAWQVLQKTEMGGPLVDSDNREWVVFAKRLKAGTTMRLVVNKYSYPHVIALGANQPGGG